MKQMILATVFLFGTAAFASAQTSGSHSSTTTAAASSTSGNSKKSKGNKRQPSDTLNNRKIYHFNDGQRATPTGAEATPSNGSEYAAIGKDTTPHVATPTNNAATKQSGRKKKQ